MWLWQQDADTECTPIRPAAYSINWLVYAGILFGIGLTLFLYRSDTDDYYYIGLAAIALDYETLPIRSIAELGTGWVLTSFTYLQAGLSRFFSIPLLVSYYIISPAIIAFMVVGFQWRLVHLLAVRHPALSMVVFFVVMMAWGDAHRTPPNFGFVRFFHGKSALFWLAIPAALLHWLKYTMDSRRKSFFLLFCSIIAGVGFSPTGAPLGVFLVALFILATLCHGSIRTHRKTLIGLGLILLYPLAIGLLMRDYFGHTSPRGQNEDGITESVLNWQIIQLVLGNNVRGFIGLLCFVVLPWTLRKTALNRLFANYSMILTFLIVYPWTSRILSHYFYITMAWRWLYAAPFVLGIVIAVDRLLSVTNRPFSKLAIMAYVSLFYLLLPGTWVISEQNRVQIMTPWSKLKEQREIFLLLYQGTVPIENYRLISPLTGRRL